MSGVEKNHFIPYLTARHRIVTKAMCSLRAIYVEMRLAPILLLTISSDQDLPHATLLLIMYLVKTAGLFEVSYRYFILCIIKTDSVHD